MLGDNTLVSTDDALVKALGDAGIKRLAGVLENCVR